MKDTGSSHSTAWPRVDSAVLLVFWLFSLFWNFDKAFHIDDTAHLEIAQWIAQQPLRPLTGLISWGNDFEPIYVTNQPPLYFYLMALVGSLFGWTEAAMHSVLAIFSLWAILTFYRLARMWFKDNALWVTGLLALNPVFVLGQNSMIDIPLLTLWMQFFFFLFNTRYSEAQGLLRAAICCALALLLKYTSLVLLPILLLHVLWRRQIRYFFLLLIPIGALGLWSVFNLYDFGKVHLIGRPVAPRSLALYSNLTLYWIGALGAMTPFAGLAFFTKIRTTTDMWLRTAWWALLVICLGSYGLVLGWYAVQPKWLAINLILILSFFLIALGLLMIAIQELWRRKSASPKVILDYLTLGYWLFAPALFLVLLTPFMAMRHVLLSLPALILLTCFGTYKSMRIIWRVSIALSLALACTLGAADKWYAEIYRVQASQIRQQFPNDTLWFNGNHGWQWYATRVGMHHYSNRLDFKQPVVGDIIIETQSVCCALPVNKTLKLALIEERIIERSRGVERFASIMPYASDLQGWGYSYAPIEKFTIWRVVKDD